MSLPLDQLEALPVDLKFTTISSGEQSVMICLISQLLMWPVDNLDSLVPPILTVLEDWGKGLHAVHIIYKLILTSININVLLATYC